jgi:hypothetical protein
MIVFFSKKEEEMKQEETLRSFLIRAAVWRLHKYLFYEQLEAQKMELDLINNEKIKKASIY